MERSRLGTPYSTGIQPHVKRQVAVVEKHWQIEFCIIQVLQSIKPKTECLICRHTGTSAFLLGLGTQQHTHTALPLKCFLHIPAVKYVLQYCTKANRMEGWKKKVGVSVPSNPAQSVLEQHLTKSSWLKPPQYTKGCVFCVFHNTIIRWTYPDISDLQPALCSNMSLWAYFSASKKRKKKENLLTAPQPAKWCSVKYCRQLIRSKSWKMH